MNLVKKHIFLASNSSQSFPDPEYCVGVFLSNYLSLDIFIIMNFYFF